MSSSSDLNDIEKDINNIESSKDNELTNDKSNELINDKDNENEDGNINNEYKNILVNELKFVFDNHLLNRLKLIKNISDEYDSIPQGYITEYSFLKYFYDDIRENFLIKLIYSYIDKRDILNHVCIIDISFIMNVINYFIMGYEENKYSFPYNMLIDDSVLSKLIRDTAYLDDKHPSKWTNERVNKLKSADNIYHKSIFYYDSLYAWYIYKWEEEFGYTLNDLTKNDILVLYLFLTILDNYSFLLRTDFIIMNKMDKDKQIRFIKVIGFIMSIFEKKLNRDKKYLFINNQIDNIYIFDGDNFSINNIYNDVSLESILKRLDNNVKKFKLFELLIKSDFSIKGGN